MRHGVPLQVGCMGAAPYAQGLVLMFSHRPFSWIHGAQLAKRAHAEMTLTHGNRLAIAFVCLIGFLTMPGRAGAQAIPQPVPLPAELSLDESLKILRARG